VGPLGQWRDGERADRWARGAGRRARAEGGGLCGLVWAERHAGAGACALAGLRAG